MNKRIIIAAALGAGLLVQTPGFTEVTISAESVAHAHWRATIGKLPLTAKGCFHASYPNFVWESVACKMAERSAHSAYRAPTTAAVPDVGSGSDYVARAHGLILFADGGFTVSGVTSEKGVAGPGGGGILGPNQYTLQLNTNADQSTSACAKGSSLCTVWQQFIYSTQYPHKNSGAALYMQYWMHNFGTSAALTHCPDGWLQSDVHCFKNSALLPVPLIPVTELGTVTLTGGAEAGGIDNASLLYGTDAYVVTGSDDVLDIATVWQEAEFNVVGNGGGSEAVFNRGALITVNLVVYDGSTLPPMVSFDGGTTGETNNFHAGTYKSSAVVDPLMQFTESVPNVYLLRTNLPRDLLTLSN